MVSTSVGCEGLEVKNGYNILIANNPVDFADKVSEVFSSPMLWDKISQNARKLVEEKCSWHQIAGTLQKIYQEIVARS